MKKINTTSDGQRKGAKLMANVCSVIWLQRSRPELHQLLNIVSDGRKNKFSGKALIISYFPSQHDQQHKNITAGRNKTFFIVELEIVFELSRNKNILYRIPVT